MDNRCADTSSHKSRTGNAASFHSKSTEDNTEDTDYTTSSLEQSTPTDSIAEENPSVTKMASKKDHSTRYERSLKVQLENGGLLWLVVIHLWSLFFIQVHRELIIECKL